ncbi:MAG TPA: hypothetical protein VK797_29660 [Tepidisphaeraceae bacterium]|nr:hypothetical protein [Tepidisphaeraceae bacterium]
MKYQIIGSNRDTGARMMLEFEAESKAAAERKATQAGMSVSRVIDVSDGYPAYSGEGRTSPRRSGGGGKLLLLVLLIVIAVAAWHFWPQINRMIHR